MAADGTLPDALASAPPRPDSSIDFVSSSM
jgi:hypothetical protein